jgi:hypothetical protein
MGIESGNATPTLALKLLHPPALPGDRVALPLDCPQKCALREQQRFANALPSVWGKTLIFRWLYPRKLVNLSESDGRALSCYAA